MKVHFVDLDRQHENLHDELDLLWRRVVTSSQFIGGELVSTFEQEWASYCHAAHAVGVANGTDSIELILKALGIGPGDEVILPANTFVATAEAVVAVGATPVFVDVDPHTLLITPENIERATGPNTAAVIAVHLYGNMPDMERIEQQCRRAQVALIEDAAQAHGAECGGRRAGSWGDAASFSFYPGKNLGAFGDGGAVTTNSASLAESIRMMANHGRSVDDRQRADVIGRNSRLDALQAGVLSIKLRHLDAWNAARRRAVDIYQQLLPTDCIMPRTLVGVDPVWHVLAVQIANRDSVAADLAGKDIGVGIHYAIPCHLQPAFQRYGPAQLPVCESVALRLLSLPLHPYLSDQEIEYVCENLGEAGHGSADS